MTGLEIAVIGMSCRFPGASDIRSYWKLLAEARETISFFSEEQLRAAGVPQSCEGIFSFSLLVNSVAPGTAARIFLGSRVARHPVTAMAALGLAAGLGSISKYNFHIAFAGLLLAGIAIRGWRPKVLNWRMAVALADDDQSAGSKAFAAQIVASTSFWVQVCKRSEAIDLVHKGRLAAALILPSGFGEASGQLFHGRPPQVEVWIDPSHQAEAAMIQGVLFQMTMEQLQKKMSDSGAMRVGLHESLEDLKSSDLPPDQRASLTRFLGNMDRAMAEMPALSSAAGGSPSASWQPLKIEQHDVAIRQEGPRNPFEITFPQGLLWGVLGCTMAFAIGFVSERTQGTLFRLQMAPIGRIQLVAGKALACAVALKILEVMEKENLADQARNLGAWLKSEIERLARTYPTVVKSARGLGFMLGIELAELLLRLHLLVQVLAHPVCGQENAQRPQGPQTGMGQGDVRCPEPRQSQIRFQRHGGTDAAADAALLMPISGMALQAARLGDQRLH